MYAINNIVFMLNMISMHNIVSIVFMYNIVI